MNKQFNKIETDDSLMETAKHGSNEYPFHYYYENMSLFDFNRIDWHWHTELEFVYIESGNVFFTVGEQHFTLNAGNGVMINSKVLHKLESNEDAVIPNFLFLPSFIAPEQSLIYKKFVNPIISSSLDSVLFFKDIPWQKNILEKMQYINTRIQSSNLNELEILTLVQEIWMLIYNNTNYSIPEDKSATKKRARLQLMMEFIQNHYQESINLLDIADSANVSKSSALNIFQDYLKITPVTYLINYRLSQAAKQLNNTEKKIETIAIDNGFSSCEYFCKCFKRAYKQTPTNYRHTKII